MKDKDVSLARFFGSFLKVIWVCTRNVVLRERL